MGTTSHTYEMGPDAGDAHAVLLRPVPAPPMYDLLRARMRRCRLDDEKCKKQSLKTVLSKQAYLLFYTLLPKKEIVSKR